jgi:hypothetical protein
MRFAHARWVEEQKTVAVDDRAPYSKFTDLLRINRGLRVVVKALESTHEGELGDRQAHLDAPLSLDNSARTSPFRNETRGTQQRFTAVRVPLRAAMLTISRVSVRQHTLRRTTPHLCLQERDSPKSM